MNHEFPVRLCKANAQAQLQVLGLMQESARLWLETAGQINAHCVAQTTGRLERLYKAGDWQALSALPPETVWRLFEAYVGDLETLHKAFMKNQTALIDGMRQVLTEWQSSVSEGASPESVVNPFPAAFPLPWLQPFWPQAGFEMPPVKPKDKPSK